MIKFDEALPSYFISEDRDHFLQPLQELSHVAKATFRGISFYIRSSSLLYALSKASYLSLRVSSGL